MLPDTLRAEIVAAFDAECKRFLDWLTSHWDADFTDREQYCLDLGRHTPPAP